MSSELTPDRIPEVCTTSSTSVNVHDRRAHSSASPLTNIIHAIHAVPQAACERLETGTATQSSRKALAFHPICGLRTRFTWLVRVRPATDDADRYLIVRE